MLTVDMNCDMGEGAGTDEAIMPFISSANIACGYHAGDEKTMRQTVSLAIKNKIAIGAHPSFPDRENFGRIDMQLPDSEIYDLITSQVRLLEKIAREAGALLNHVKPHGALYNMAARDQKLSAVISRAVKDVDKKLIVYGLSGSHLIKEAQKIGMRTASEVFADRTYRDDGSLTPRSHTNALIENVNTSVQQALQMIKQNTTTSVNGKTVPIVADTICIHGDGKNAIEFAKAIHNAFGKEGIEIKKIE